MTRTLRLKFGTSRAWLRYLASPVIILGLLLIIYRGVTGPGVELFKRANPLFFLAMAALFFGLFNAATEIASERPIFRRERLAGLGIGPYLISKVLVLGLLTTAQVLVLTLPALWILQFDGSASIQIAALVLTGLVAMTTGLLLSSLAPRPEAALILVPILLIAQMLLAGFIEPIRAPHMRAMGAPMAIRWSTELLLHTEYDHLDRGPTLIQPASQAQKWQALFMSNRGYRFDSKGWTFGWLVLTGLLYLLGTAVTLRLRDPAVLRRRKR